MTQTISRSFPERLYSLDVLRGVAALSVVVFHWTFFFQRGTDIDPTFGPIRLPLYSYLFPFYEAGDKAVDLFFVLSGFVFFWLYAEKVASRSISAWNFAVLRFSRLYPLHLATLVFVLFMLFQNRRLVGSAFVYPNNDTWHFCLQLVFASDWGLFESGHSFNGPIWSVSIEVLLYTIFFFVCVHRFSRPYHVVILCILGVFVGHILGALGRGMFGYFAGGLAFYVARFLVARKCGFTFLCVILALCVAAWITAIVAIKCSLLFKITALLQSMKIPGLTDAIVSKILAYSCDKAVAGGLFPLTIISLVLLEARRGSLGRRVAFLGDISYSSYLLHYPLQLLIVSLFLSQNWSFHCFQKSWALIAFYLILIPLSMFVFRFYERPAQYFLRKRLH